MWDRGLIQRLRFLTWPFRRAWCVLVGHSGPRTYYKRNPRDGGAITTTSEGCEWSIQCCRRCQAIRRIKGEAHG